MKLVERKSSKIASRIDVKQAMFYVNVAAVKLFQNGDNKRLARCERVIKIMLGPDPFRQGKIVINYSRWAKGQCVA